MTQRNRLPRKESRSYGQVVATLAPTRHRTSVLSGVKVSRAPRAAPVQRPRDLDAASARPLDGIYRSEPAART
jgi:hypothetical protein